MSFARLPPHPAGSGGHKHKFYNVYQPRANKQHKQLNKKFPPAVTGGNSISIKWYLLLFLYNKSNGLPAVGIHITPVL